jgi:hypothetical protein
MIPYYYRTSHHRDPQSTHATVRGFNKDGCLRFTGHLRSSEGEVQEEIWLYQVMERFRRPIRYETSGATIWIITGTRESHLRFSAEQYDLIPVCLLSFSPFYLI